MSIEKTVERGDITVEIDDWAGCHFHFPDDDENPRSLSPNIMNDIQDARLEVLEE